MNIEDMVILANSQFSLTDIRRLIGFAGAIAVGYGLVQAIILINSSIKQRGGSGGGGSMDGITDGLLMAGAIVIVGGAATAIGIGDLFIPASWGE